MCPTVGQKEGVRRAKARLFYLSILSHGGTGYEGQSQP